MGYESHNIIQNLGTELVFFDIYIVFLMMLLVLKFYNYIGVFEKQY